MAEKGPFAGDTDEYRSLRVLEEIEKNPHVSQRELATRVGVALGIANSLVHTLVRRGMIKIRGENNRSITYHLTKQGVGHKTSLAMQWTMNTIGFYRDVRQLISAGLSKLAQNGVSSVVVLGANELAEITIVVSGEAGVEVKAVVRHASSYAKDRLIGVPVGDVSLIAEAGADALVLCMEPADPDLPALVASLPPGSPPVYTFNGEPFSL